MDKDFVAAVEKGLKEIDNENVIPLEQVKQIIDTWKGTNILSKETDGEN